MHHRSNHWREGGLCAAGDVYLLEMALRMGWDGMGTRFLQLVVRNPILQLSCLEISLLLSPSAASRAHVALRKT